MISIITAVYNQLAMNRLFLRAVRKFTAGDYELIVIDNASTDGSGDFFAAHGATVVRNKGNYPYPVCQNQGIAAARGGLLAFLNNDTIVAPDWDRTLAGIMSSRGLDILCPCGMERLERTDVMRRRKKRWGVIKALVGFFGSNHSQLQLMLWLMYGNWERFARKVHRIHGSRAIEGFNGNSVLMTRAAIEKVGLWDERLQAADWDLYARSKRRQATHHDIRPVHVALGVYHHHYMRLTVKGGYPPMIGADKLIQYDDKWGNTEQVLSRMSDPVMGQ